jgi:hypothetical protein
MYYIYYDTHDLSIMGNGEDLIKNIQQNHKVPLIGALSFSNLQITFIVTHNLSIMGTEAKTMLG